VPRYFFHLRYEHESKDGEGVELPDFQAAWAEAVRAFGRMLEGLEGSPAHPVPFEMTIEDERGNPLCRLRFLAEILERRADRRPG
jgi:hypothetical protein